MASQLQAIMAAKNVIRDGDRYIGECRVSYPEAAPITVWTQVANEYTKAGLPLWLDREPLGAFELQASKQLTLTAKFPGTAVAVAFLIGLPGREPVRCAQKTPGLVVPADTTTKKA